MRVRNAVTRFSARRPMSTSVKASSRAFSRVGMKAPVPTLTSSTKASMPSASFLLIMLEAMSGIDGTQAVASRSA
jgi:hypothetical protein